VTRARRAVTYVALTVACTISLACAYPCSEARNPLFTFSFEIQCADALCGFHAVTGQATRVIGFTYGEHVMRLEGGSEATRDLGVSVGAGREYVSLLARCEGGSTLRFQELAYEGAARDAGDGAAPDAGPTVPRILLREQMLGVAARWARHIVEFEARPVEAGGPRDQLGVLSILVVGSGACFVDDIEFGTIPSCGRGG